MLSDEETRKGKEAEQKFIEYLESKGLSYINFNQDIQSYSSNLRHLFGKRSDFQIYNPYRRPPTIVEVKYRLISEKKFTLNFDEAKKFQISQAKINSPFWFALSND
jgi:hypothetical protein